MLGDIEVCLTKDISSLIGTETEKEVTTEKNSNSPSCKDKENNLEQEKSYQNSNINIMIGKKTRRKKDKDQQNDESICIICNIDEPNGPNKSNFNINEENDLYKCNQCKKSFHLSCFKAMNKEIRDEIMSQCPLCEILIRNDFEDLNKFFTKIIEDKTIKKKSNKKI